MPTAANVSVTAVIDIDRELIYLLHFGNARPLKQVDTRPTGELAEHEIVP
jgi:hypothetical protein